MAFKDELLEIVKLARQQQEQEAREERTLEGRWDDFRKTVIAEVFREAKIALQGVCGADFSLPNGSIVLEAVYESSRRDFAHSLTFKLDKSKRQVVCTSSFEKLSETFDLDQLTGEVVQERVRQFTFAAAGGKGQVPSTSIYDQRLKEGKPLLETL